MFDLGTWANKWTIKVQIYPDFTFNSTYLPSLSILQFSIDINFQAPQTWFGVSFFILSIVVFLLTTLRIQIQFLILEAFYFSFLVKVYKMVQCFSFLIFLPPLETFGLEPPIPVGIRILGVETPLRT